MGRKTSMRSWNPAPPDPIKVHRRRARCPRGPGDLSTSNPDRVTCPVCTLEDDRAE